MPAWAFLRAALTGGGRHAGALAERRMQMYRILIVEDDRGIAESLRELAGMWGLEARCVEHFRNVVT